MGLSVGVIEDLAVGVTGSMAVGDTGDLAVGETVDLVDEDSGDLAGDLAGVPALVSFPGDLSMAGWCDLVEAVVRSLEFGSKSLLLKSGMILETVMGYQIMAQ